MMPQVGDVWEDVLIRFRVKKIEHRQVLCEWSEATSWMSISWFEADNPTATLVERDGKAVAK